MKIDDIVSTLWLTLVGICLAMLTAAVSYNIYVGRIAVSGDIPIAAVFSNLVAPIVLLVTALAVLDVYGKRRIKSLLDLARGQGVEVPDDASDVADAQDEYMHNDDSE